MRDETTNMVFYIKREHKEQFFLKFNALLKSYLVASAFCSVSFPSTTMWFKIDFCFPLLVDFKQIDGETINTPVYIARYYNNRRR